MNEPRANHHHAAWQLDDHGAQLSCGPLLGRVELDGRGTRFIVSTWQNHPSDAFGAFITAGPGPRPQLLEPGECYVRGSDFVASYAATPEYRLAPHFYWRSCWQPPFSAVQIEMILSVQTDLLDSRPEASLHSFALASRLFWLSARESAVLEGGSFEELASGSKPRIFERASGETQLALFRNEMLGLSYAEMVHPSDFVSRSAVCRSSGWFVESVLFPERLEKGVIRRARVCGWFLPANNDLEAAAALAGQFLAEPLPLTA